MTRTRGTTIRAILLAALALVLHGATCRTRVCSGDGCEDDREEDGSATELVVLPAWAPFGFPPNGPIPRVIRRPR